MNANVFSQQFTIELKRFKRPLTVVVSLIICLSTIFFFYYGKDVYVAHITDKNELLRIEKEKVNHYSTSRTGKEWTYYGGYGIRIAFIPSPSEVLSIENNLKLRGRVDTGPFLRIYSPKKESFMQRRKYKYLSFSTLAFLLMISLTILYGLNVLRSENIRYYVTTDGYAKAFFLVILAKLSIILIGHILFLFTSIISAVIVGLNIYKEISILIFSLFNISILTFLAGVFVGTFRKNKIAMAVSVFSGFIFLSIITPIISIGNPKIKELNIEYNNLIDVMNFEKGASKRIVPKEDSINPNNKTMKLEELRKLKYKLAVKSVKNEYVRVNKRESLIVSEIKENSRSYYKLSSIIPGGFYFSTIDSLSGFSPENFICFYKFAQDIKFDFCNFYIDGRYSESKPKKIIPFCQTHNVVFNSKSHFPLYFIQAILLNLLYSMFLSFFSYIRFKASVFKNEAIQEDLEGIEDYRLDIRSGGITSFFSRDKRVREYLLCNLNFDFVYCPANNINAIRYAISRKRAIVSVDFFKGMRDIQIGKIKGNIPADQTWLNFESDRGIFDHHADFSRWWNGDKSVPWSDKSENFD